MGKNKKLFEQVLLGRSDADIAFSGLCILLGRIGFNEQVRNIILKYDLRIGE